MKTSIVSSRDMFLNCFTKYGRKRNDVISYMQEKGCKIIKEHKESCKSRVYLGYVNENSSYAKCSARVNRNGEMVYKDSDIATSPLQPLSRDYDIYKVHSYKDGHIDITQIRKKFVNGKKVEDFNVTRTYENA